MSSNIFLETMVPLDVNKFTQKGYAVIPVSNADSLKHCVDKARLCFLLTGVRKTAISTVYGASQSGENKVEIFIRSGGSG